MEQFNGAGCCLCFVVITLTHQNGRIKCGLTICREEVTRKDFSIAWPLTVTFSTCAIQGNSEGNKVDTSLQDNMEIQYNWIEYIYHVGSFDYRREKIRKKEDKRYFSAVDPMSEPREDQPYDVTKPRQVPDRTRWKVHWNAVYWINLGSAQDQGLVFWQTLSDAIIFHNSAPADCLEQVVKTQTGKILYQKTSFITASATNGYFEECLASSTRRSTSSWNLCRATCCKRGGDGTYKRVQNSGSITCRR